MTDVEKQKWIDIALFMGFRVKDFGAHGVGFAEHEEIPEEAWWNWNPLKDMALDTFSPIMLVIDKIESLGYSTVIGFDTNAGVHWISIFNGKEFQRKKIQEVHGTAEMKKIDVVFQGVAKFCKWYNQKQKILKPCGH